MIVLVTDFGPSGPYVGQMKAVLCREAPGVPVIDLFCDAPAFDPQAAAYLLPAYAGLLLLAELEHLGRLLGEIERPFVIVAGGAKVEDKVGVLRHLGSRADRVRLTHEVGSIPTRYHSGSGVSG